MTPQSSAPAGTTPVDSQGDPRRGLLEHYIRLRERLIRAASGEQGQGMVEYALILVLIAVVVIVVLAVVGNQVKNTFSNISNGLQ